MRPCPLKISGGGRRTESESFYMHINFDNEWNIIMDIKKREIFFTPYNQSRRKRGWACGRYFETNCRTSTLNLIQQSNRITMQPSSSISSGRWCRKGKEEVGGMGEDVRAGECRWQRMVAIRIKRRARRIRIHFNQRSHCERIY